MLLLVIGCRFAPSEEASRSPGAAPIAASPEPSPTPIEDPTLRQYLRLDAGTVVRNAGRDDAQAIAVLAADESAQLLRASPPWYRVRAGDGETLGWVRLNDDEAANRTLRVRDSHRRPRPSAPPSATVLARARGHMRGAREGRCGPYRLLTNETDSLLLTACDQLAGELDRAYATRYGVEPAGAAREAIILFARLGELRAFVAEHGGAGNGYGAFAEPSEGYLAMHAENERRTTLQTLVHELSHLVHRRALGDLPRWLSEGLADGLGDTATEDGLLPGPGIAGSEVQARRLRQARRDGRAGSVESVITQADEHFDRGTVSFDYETSALFVRYLLSDPARAAALRAFLRAVAEGERAEAGQLRDRLDASWGALDQAFDHWLAQALGG